MNGSVTVTAIMHGGGARIVFYSLRVGQQIWVMWPDGSDQRAITAGADSKFHPLWNPLAQPGS